MDILSRLASSDFFEIFNQQVWDYSLLIGIVFFILIIFKVTKIEASERLGAVLMFFYFFLVIAGFWITKPLKKGFFLEYYTAHPFSLFGFSFNPAQVELLAKEVNVFVAICASLIFIKLVGNYRKEKLSVIVTSFFIVQFVLLGGLLSMPTATTAWLYYLSGDLFSTVMVATFFAFLNATKAPAQARSMYAFIGLGGVLGGFFGSTMIANNAHSITLPNAAYLCALICVLILGISMWLGGITKEQHILGAAAPEEYGKSGWLHELSQDINIIIRSKYLVSVAIIVCLYEVISTLVDYQFTTTILHFVEGPELGGYFSNVFGFTNFVSLVTQLFITGFIMSKFGVLTALMVLPIMLAMGSLAFFTMPILIFGSLLNTFDNGFSYSINQSAKEALYVTVPMEKRYKAKAFVDIFLIRFSKGFAVILSLFLTIIFAEFESVRWLSLLVFILLLVWVKAVFYVGRIFNDKEAAIIKNIKVDA